MTRQLTSVTQQLNMVLTILKVGNDGDNTPGKKAHVNSNNPTNMETINKLANGSHNPNTSQAN